MELSEEDRAVVSDPHDSESKEGFYSLPDLNPSVSHESGNHHSVDVQVKGQEVIAGSDQDGDSYPSYAIINPRGMSMEALNVLKNAPLAMNIGEMVKMEQQQQHSIDDPLSGIEGTQCMVCGDRGSGFHYSVFSCEGCKGFFKRTVQKNLVYTCKQGEECSINKFTRNSCQYCRFQKCLMNGMKKEAVREDRSPGGKHRSGNKRQRTDSGESLLMMPAPPEIDRDGLIMHDLLEAQADIKPTFTDIYGDNPPQPVCMDINDLMQYGYVELRLIIEWARKVPGFSKLAIDDQMALLKSSFMELNVLRLAYRSAESQGLVQFTDGVMLSSEQGAHLGWGKDLIDGTLSILSRFKDIRLDYPEFSIVAGILLFFPDAAGLHDKTSVESLQTAFLECLRRRCLEYQPDDRRRFPKILLRLPALRVIAAKVADRFLSVSLESNVKMNALVLEMMR